MNKKTDEPAAGAPAVGVLVVGHGQTASCMLRAARAIVAAGALDGVIAVDAGVGDSPEFTATMCEALREVDQGRGVLMLVDLLGASPHKCGRREGTDLGVVTLAGLNLAMLLKLSTLDRRGSSTEELAQACAGSAQRAVHVSPAPKHATESH